MSFTWVSLALVALIGLGKLFFYFNSSERKLKILKAREYELEEKLRAALARVDTVVISDIERELNRVRAQINYFNTK